MLYQGYKTKHTPNFNYKTSNMLYIHYYHSPLGRLTFASDGEYLVGVWFDTQQFHDIVALATATEQKLPVFEDTCRWFDLYFQGKEPDFMPKIRLIGTDFRKEVWEILASIPYGKTITYKDIANELAHRRGIDKMSARAVGGAVGHNPISVIIPCHRVIGSDGSLTGYTGGLDIKVFLLELERF